MSRYKIKCNWGVNIQREFIYGFDRALGYWFEVRDAAKGGELIFERDSIGLYSKTGPMSNSYFLQMLEMYGAPEEHRTRVALDQPF